MSDTHTKKRTQEILDYAMQMGTKEAAEHFGVKEETVDRYLRKAQEWKLTVNENTIMSKIRNLYSDDELKALSKGGFQVRRDLNKNLPTFKGKHFKIGCFSDPHIGSVYTDYAFFDAMFGEFEEEDVDMICVVGDIHEGMSHRPGHVFECTEIGYNRQLDASTEIFGRTERPVFMIDGNHDRWYIKKSGAIIVDALCERLDHCTFLGHDEGSVDLAGCELRLWHGEDGNSYATSYRVQKILESLTGGDKPNILLCGHTHKQFYMYERMVHAYSMGSIQKQSKWMRGKRIPAHVGFWIIDAWVDNKQVSKIRGTWYPFYQ